MKKYKNLAGNSGITFYEIGKDFIKVRFQNQDLYTYNYSVPGKQKVEHMKQLATEGKGLSTFISREVGENYFKKE